MGVFQDIELVWEGNVYTIRSHKVMGAIARIEDVITMPELQAYSNRGTYPLGKLCSAYGAVLRYAGARVTDDAIYELAFSGPGAQEAVIEGVMNLMKMMVPASARTKLENAMAAGDDAPAGDPDSGNSRPTVTASLPKRTKRRSAKANG
jgi:hypothetical protein